MFPSPLQRPSASRSLTRPSASTRTVSPPHVAEAPATPSATWTIEDLDRRFRAFLDTAGSIDQKSRDTLRGYRWAYENFRRFLLTEGSGTAPLGDRLFQIAQWVGWNTKRGISGVTTNSLWRALRAFFHDLARYDAIPDPFVGMRPPVMPTVLPKARSVEELRLILHAAENYPWPSAFHRARAVAILGTLIYAGLRKGELLRLAFTDVDLAEETLRIRRGKGRGGGKDRVAYIGPELRPLLHAVLRERTRLGIVAPGFFAGQHGSAYIAESTLIRITRKVRRASGVPFSIHSLRHSFVTMLLKSGVPIHVVQSLAGHASLVTTAGYLRVFDEERRSAAARLRLR